MAARTSCSAISPSHRNIADVSRLMYLLHIRAQDSVSSFHEHCVVRRMYKEGSPGSSSP